MQTEAYWYDERKKAVVITVRAKRPDWTDFDLAVDHAFELARSVPHEIILIFDPHGFPIPKEGTPVPHLLHLKRGLPSNVKFIVAVIGSLGLFERSIGNIMANISFGKRLKLVHSSEEAYQLIP